MLPGRISSHTLILSAILLLAAGLRFYDFTHIPFTNDELSALLRIGQSSFWELIREGVIPDGHPALVQVFLHYYCNLFGTTEWVVKLPFALCGLAAIYFTYRVAALVHNRNLGLLVAGMMATSQYFILYSQVARPYAVGLLLIMLTCYYGLRIVLLEERNWRTYTLLVLMIGLAALTHYFAQLSVLFIACGLLVLEQGAHRKKLLYAYSAVVLLYLPHMAVFIAQLQRGGVGSWLGKPETYFFFHYAEYVAQYFWPTYILLTLAFLVSLYYLAHAPVTTIRLMLLSAGVAVLTALTGYFYSRFRNPVLQYSVLLFCIPLFLFIVFYGISKLKQKVSYTFLVLLITANVYALINERKHYTLFYDQGYAAAVRTALAHPKAALLMNGNNAFYFDYYFRKYDHLPAYLTTRFDTLSCTDFKTLLSTLRQDTLVLAYGMPGDPTYLSIAQTYFPNRVYEKRGCAHECFVLTRSASIEPMDRMQFLGSNSEYGPDVSLSLDTCSRFSNIEISADVATASNAELVCSITDSTGKTLFWKAYACNDYKLPGDSTTRITAQFRLHEVVKWVKQTSVHTAVLNKDKKEIRVTLPRLRILKGNPYLYGLIEDMESE